MTTIDEIISAVKSYNPHASEEILRKAYTFSDEAHAGQTRRSGEPFLIHPLEVSKILIQLKMDTSSIVAAILHDTIEDTSVTKPDIEANFGKEVADIVDGVTKISKIKFTTQHDRQAENYRKMLLAMSKDIRVIMVKLADRINNMRTLQYMPEARQVQISQETLDIYAPIAGRMGVYWAKEELETLSFRFLKPQIHQQIMTVISRLQKKRESYMDKVIEILKKNINPAVREVEISGRIKKPYSIYKKMQHQQISLDDVHDLLAFRVLVRNIEQCYDVLGTIHSLWRPIQGRFKDYIAVPKGNNYQSLHTTVVCFEGERVEFQIRTFEMHEIAEKGIASHWQYKEDGRLDTRDEAKFRWLRELVNWQQELKDSLEFVDTVKLDLFEDEIFVFTPKGDLKTLCRNATPVDFAYAIHSEVGNFCAGARVNGRLVQLNHKLESGDAVEIIAKKNHVPSKDWLDFVVTSKAKTHIRQVIRKEQREKSIAIGRNLLEAACQKRGVSAGELLRRDAFKKYLADKKYVHEEDLFTDFAYGKIAASEVLDVLCSSAGGKVEDEGGVLKKIIHKIGIRHKNLILVDQQDDVLVAFAKCCYPVKGDPVVGFVTRDRGVVVHRTECQRVLNSEPERRVQIDWNPKPDQVSLTKVLIISEDRKGILAEITKTVSERNVNISRVTVKTLKDGLARIYFDLNVRDVHELRKVMSGIENIRYVLKVLRQ